MKRVVLFFFEEIPLTALAVEIREARTAIEGLLEQIGLGNYVYSLESKDGRWQVHLECNSEGGWCVFTLPVNVFQLRASLHDPALQSQLRSHFGDRLAACERTSVWPWPKHSQQG